MGEGEKERDGVGNEGEREGKRKGGREDGRGEEKERGREKTVSIYVCT